MDHQPITTLKVDIFIIIGLKDTGNNDTEVENLNNRRNNQENLISRSILWHTIILLFVLT